MRPRTRSLRCAEPPARRRAAGPCCSAARCAEAYDTRQALKRDNRIIVPLGLALILLILAVLLRAVVMPLYVIATVILSFGFALGVSSLVFTHVMGQPGERPDPASSSRSSSWWRSGSTTTSSCWRASVRSATRGGLTTRQAVITALERTGGVITSAGLVLAATFSVLMALPLESLFQVGLRRRPRAARRHVPGPRPARPFHRRAARRAELVAEQIGHLGSLGHAKALDSEERSGVASRECPHRTLDEWGAEGVKSASDASGGRGSPPRGGGVPGMVNRRSFGVPVGRAVWSLVCGARTGRDACSCRQLRARAGTDKRVLLYTGTTGFRHTDGINGGRPVVQSALRDRRATRWTGRTAPTTAVARRTATTPTRTRASSRTRTSRSTTRSFY